MTTPRQDSYFSDFAAGQRNVMLLAAGFAPAYHERPLSDPELHSVKQALDFMLQQQAPTARSMSCA